MKKRLAMLFALCLMTGVLSSCGKDSGSTETTKKDDNTLVILNYGKYIDESVLDQFEKETGIKVKLEEYESPEEMYTKFSAGSINYDLVCTSDYMVERLINEDQVLEINFDDFEYYKNLDSSIIKRIGRAHVALRIRLLRSAVVYFIYSGSPVKTFVTTA